MFTRLKKLALTVGALGAFAMGGAALADAASSGSTGATGTTSLSGPAPSGAPAPSGMAAPGTAAHEAAETVVSGATAEKARAAAVAAVGGTAGEVTTNYDKTGYEVTVTKSDGSTEDVHMNLSFEVQHGPGPHGPMPAGPPPNSASA